jgi:50S ribosomal subunit-associated GTPase HflX
LQLLKLLEAFRLKQVLMRLRQQDVWLIVADRSDTKVSASVRAAHKTLFTIVVFGANEHQ